jgi:hypothetical protein
LDWRLVRGNGRSLGASPIAKILVVVRVLFCVLAIVVTRLLILEPDWGFHDLDLNSIGILATSLGMAVPWSKWISWTAPGKNLGFLSKFLGWSGACALPVVVEAEAWPLLPFCLLFPLSARALWKGRTWAAWPWYAVGIGLLASSAVGLFRAIRSLPSVEDGGAIADALGGVLAMTLWGAVGVATLREVTAWRRNRRASSAEPPSVA